MTTIYDLYSRWTPSPDEAQKHPQITRRRDGIPRIKGTHLKVRMAVEAHKATGLRGDDLRDHLDIFGITGEHLDAALDFYDDHREEIDWHMALGQVFVLRHRFEVMLSDVHWSDNTALKRHRCDPERDSIELVLRKHDGPDLTLTKWPRAGAFSDLLETLERALQGDI